jgi:hypothetical protein
MSKSPASRRMSLKNWIDKQGVRAVAETLDVRTATVNYWRRGRSLPRAHQMAEIKKLSRGAVSYDIMIEAFLSQNGGR